MGPPCVSSSVNWVRKGWLAPAYPKEYGGSQMSHIRRLILAEELYYHRAP